MQCHANSFKLCNDNSEMLFDFLIIVLYMVKVANNTLDFLDCRTDVFFCEHVRVVFDERSGAKNGD